MSTDAVMSTETDATSKPVVGAAAEGGGEGSTMKAEESAKAPAADETGNSNKENNGTTTPKAAPGSNTKTAPSPAAAAASTTASSSDQLPPVVDFEPPTACVRRILKNTMPPSTNVGKDALAAFQRSVGIFIIYLTACSNDFARENRRQTITANDVLAAVQVRSPVPVGQSFMTISILNRFYPRLPIYLSLDIRKIY